MRKSWFLQAITVGVGALALAAAGGCAQQRADRGAARLRGYADGEGPPLYVPSTAVINTGAFTSAESGEAANLRKVAAGARVARGPVNAFAVLPSSEAEDFYVPRGQRAVFGAQVLYESSAFTLYTSDAVPIATPGGTGWHYRWVERHGVEIP